MINKLRYLSTRAQIIKYLKFISKLQSKIICSQVFNQVNNLTSQVQNKIYWDKITTQHFIHNPIINPTLCINFTHQLKLKFLRNHTSITIKILHLLNSKSYKITIKILHQLNSQSYTIIFKILHIILHQLIKYQNHAI